MGTGGTLLLVLDLLGVFAFALNGALTAVRTARLDVVGVVALGLTTALGGGVLRDLLLGATPPATFSDWRYLAVAAGGGLLAFATGRRLERLLGPITVLDAAGLALFAVTGASKALDSGLGPVPAVLLGALTGVGGGTLRDVLLRQVPTVLVSELYAIPAMLAATVVVATDAAGVYGLPAAVGAAALCFAVRMLGVRFGLNAPRTHEPRESARGGAMSPGSGAGPIPEESDDDAPAGPAEPRERPRMTIRQVFAQATVTDLDAAERWYSNLFDRAPDARPMDGLVEWHLDSGSGIQVWREPDRAGGGTVVLGTDDLDGIAERLTRAGVAHAGIEPASSSRVLRIADPDGNRVVLTGR